MIQSIFLDNVWITGRKNSLSWSDTQIDVICSHIRSEVPVSQAVYHCSKQVRARRSSFRRSLRAGENFPFQRVKYVLTTFSIWSGYYRAAKSLYHAFRNFAAVLALNAPYWLVLTLLLAGAVENSIIWKPRVFGLVVNLEAYSGYPRIFCSWVYRKQPIFFLVQQSIATVHKQVSAV